MLIILIVLIVFFSFFEVINCWLSESENFYLGYMDAKIEILLNSRVNKFFYGKISAISPEFYKKLKIVIYVYVENDVWNIHPDKNSYSEIRSNGSWNIRWVQRVKAHRPNNVCALLVPKKCIKTPELLDDPSQIGKAVISPMYAIIGDTAIVKINRLK